MIAANQVQQLMGQYVAIPTWSITTTAVYTATPVLVSYTATGVTVTRIDWGITITHSAAGGGALVALYRDGAAILTAHYVLSGGANYPMPLSGTFYESSVPAGTRQYQIYLYNAAAGTLSLSTSANQWLAVTEQRR